MGEYKIGGWNVVGALARAAVFGDVLFVDGDYGSVDNPGDQPNIAVALPSTAVTKSARGDVIYVRPRSTGGSVQTYYVDNITFPLAKPNLQMLGCSSDPDNPYNGVDLKASVATSPLIGVYGAGVKIADMRITGTGQTADTASILNVVNDGTVGRGYGLSVRGCRFANGKGHLISAGAAISIDTAIMAKIENCVFSDCLAGITVRTVYAAINGLRIIGCTFEGTPAGRDVDIFITGNAGRGLLIKGCDFNDGLPNHGVVNRFIQIDGTGLLGMVSDCNFAYTSATGDAIVSTAGAACIIPATVFIVRCHLEGSGEQAGLTTR